MEQLNKKKNGIVYTPVELADIMAEKLFELITFNDSKKVYKILDPACGNGVLLEAVFKAAKKRKINAEFLKFIGFDTDADALEETAKRLKKLNSNFILKNENFLKYSKEHEYKVDAVIANPPYVRTQSIDDETSKKISKELELSGKFDLYQSFYAMLPKILKENGVISVITSNKFLSNKTGGDLRKILVSNFDIKELIDLGDTKLFEAAVLPAIVVGCLNGKKSESFKYYKIYESPDNSIEISKKNEKLYSIIANEKIGKFIVNNILYESSEGVVNVPLKIRDPWILASKEENEWARKIEIKFKKRIKDIANVRVGIKTTADKVFIRNSWDEIKPMPEKELIHTLYNAKSSKKWTVNDDDVADMKKILYPMLPGNKKRKAIPIKLNQYPNTQNYLEAHYDELSSRRYVIDAGRKWYEIWGPQDPKLWSEKKIIFPDISDKPKFMMDNRKLYVDGNCYWITLKPNIEKDYLYLILGISNSKILQKYHSICFQNKLYSNKYRYITQYVEKYPIPDVNLIESQRIIKIVKKILSDDKPNIEVYEKQIEEEMKRIINL